MIKVAILVLLAWSLRVHIAEGEEQIYESQDLESVLEDIFGPRKEEPTQNKAILGNVKNEELTEPIIKQLEYTEGQQSNQGEEGNFEIDDAFGATSDIKMANSLTLTEKTSTISPETGTKRYDAKPDNSPADVKMMNEQTASNTVTPVPAIAFQLQKEYIKPTEQLSQSDKKEIDLFSNFIAQKLYSLSGAGNRLTAMIHLLEAFKEFY